MLYSQDKLLLILKNNHLRGLSFVDLCVNKSTLQILRFFITKGYVLSISKLDSNKVRIYLNCSQSSPLILFSGNFSKQKTSNISSKLLLKYFLGGKRGLFFSPAGLVDLSQSLQFQQLGGVRPIFLSRY